MSGRNVCVLTLGRINGCLAVSNHCVFPSVVRLDSVVARAFFLGQDDDGIAAITSGIRAGIASTGTSDALPPLVRTTMSPNSICVSHLTTAAATAAAATIATLGDVKSRLSAAAAAPRCPLRWKDGSGMIV